MAGKAVKTNLKLISKNKKGIEQLRKLTKPGAIKVGILKGVGEHPGAENGQTVAEIGAWNEFGTPDAKHPIPERPFLRTTLKEQGPMYVLMMDDLLGKMLRGEISIDVALGLLGVKAQSDVQAKIVSISEPPNAPRTLAEKAPKTNPLIDTGALRNSISWGKV